MAYQVKWGPNSNRRHSWICIRRTGKQTCGALNEKRRQKCWLCDGEFNPQVSKKSA